MKLRDYILKRLLLTIPTILGVMSITFVLSHIIPADPIVMWLGGPEAVRLARPEVIARIRDSLHLDDPLWIQYIFYIKAVLQGDLGMSPMTHNPVIVDLIRLLPATIELALISMMIALIIGIVAGVMSATHKDGLADHASRIFSLLGVALPNFWLALILQLVFYYYLGWFPDPGGRMTDLTAWTHPVQRITGFLLIDSVLTLNKVAFFDVAIHTIMPAIVLGYRSVAMITRLTRSSMLEVLNQDYIRTARAGGLKEKVIIYKHALRNALVPTVTTAGMTFSYLLSGSLAVEMVFYWPGIGWYSGQSITMLDYPAIQGVTLVVGIIFVFMNLIVDLLYGVLDPRVRYE